MFFNSYDKILAILSNMYGIIISMQMMEHQVNDKISYKLLNLFSRD